jgi:hypothetical protein
MRHAILILRSGPEGRISKGENAHGVDCNALRSADD